MGAPPAPGALDQLEAAMLYSRAFVSSSTFLQSGRQASRRRPPRATLTKPW
ncbi:hypothetical protein ISF6_1068 [Piscinibacter sakaiensis]|uniref:Uncharacterized protein n=1 Tax=Piscinibacter sakaiensis TaxID=1547922 RepID=A0A0K8NTX3_PISS1|nr:hypothetical protein ISF6_1068 [Piscinibacter sakaiensis]